MEEMYITITSFNNYHGIKPFKINSILKLVKEPENQYDSEAIMVEMRYAGKVAYVSNSVSTVNKGTWSAGRVYDKILNEDYAEIKFIAKDSLIAKILNSEEIDQYKQDSENDINFL